MPQFPCLKRFDFCNRLWKLEFPGVATSLDFAPAEITAIITDANYALFVCRSSADGDSYSSAWVRSRSTMLNGNPNQGIVTFPGTNAPAQPPVAIPLPGINTRLRATVRRIKGSPNDTPTIGQTLRIVTATTPADPNAAKPRPKVKALPMFSAEVRWPRLSFSGVIVRSQRGGESAWTEHGIKTGMAFVDDRAPATANQPEQRRYQLIYVQNDNLVGQWSDVIGVTVQP